MSNPSQLASFMPRRWEELVALLHGNGFDVASNPHPQFPSEWRDDPPLGLVRLKGVWLPNADTDPEAEEDDRVTFSMMERWSVEPTGFSTVDREGLWLAGYAYNGFIDGPCRGKGERNLRHDFDPAHPDLPYHCHPFLQANDVRVAENPVTPEDAIAEFKDLLTTVRSGRFTRSSSA